METFKFVMSAARPEISKGHAIPGPIDFIPKTGRLKKLLPVGEVAKQPVVILAYGVVALARALRSPSRSAI
jgi:hypothetical protein